MRAYTIKTTKTEGKAPLYTKVKRAGFKEVMLNCLLDVDIMAWRKCGSIEKYNEYTDDSKFVAKIIEIDKRIKALQKDVSIISDDDFRCTLKAAVDDVVNGEGKREKEKKEAEREREEKERKGNIHAYVSELINGMKSGDVRKIGMGKGERYTPGTIRTFSDFLKVYDGFDKLHIYRFTDINNSFYNLWETYLISRGYMRQSIRQFNCGLKRMMNRAAADGVAIGDKGAVAVTANAGADKSREQVYLTREELDALYKMELSGTRGAVRDIFLVGCFTCQRVSDYGRITPDNITTTARGNKVIKLIQKKTGTKVCVPVLDSRLEAILDKYGYDLPHYSNALIGLYMKEILRELSEDVASLRAPVKTYIPAHTRKALGIKDDVAEIPKWRAVGTHTARRTGITLLYQSHKFDSRQIMSVSGHKSVETFKKYIRLTEEETADEIADIASNEQLF